MIGLLNRLPISLRWEDYALAAGLLFVTWLLRKSVLRFLVQLTTKIVKKNTVREIAEGLEKPLSSLLLLAAVMVGLGRVITAPGWGLFSQQVIKSSLVIAVAASLYRMEGLYEGFFDRMDGKLSMGSSQIIRKMTIQVVRALLLTLAFVMVLSEFGFDVNGFIAGLGIAGLAIAMATQRSLSNVVAGLSILMDKPYDIGDLVECQGIFGSVEAINFRSTRIRNFDKQLVVVPNIIMADNALYNYSRRDNRSVRFHLGLVYATPAEKLDRVARRIREMLLGRTDVDNERLNVTFERFNDSSLDLLIYYYTMTSDWNVHLTIQHDINLKIMDILQDEKASVAFPSQSVYFENPLKTAPPPMQKEGPAAR